VKGIIRENLLPQLENAMHTGKRDGMFTKERYLDEFLNPKETFVLSSQSFRPTPESVPDAGYTSSLIGGGIQTPRSTLDLPSQIKRPETEERALSQRQTTFQTGSDGEPHYVIDENENLQDLIAKLDK